MFPLNWCNTTSLHSEFNVAWFNKSKAAWVLLFTFNLLYHIILVFTIKLCKHRSINHDSRCLQFQSERWDFFRFFFKLRNLKPTDAFRFFSFFAIHGLFCSSTNSRTFYVNVRHLGKTTWQKANENCWAFISNFLLNKAQKWTTIISNDQNKQQDAVFIFGCHSFVCSWAFQWKEQNILTAENHNPPKPFGSHSPTTTIRLKVNHINWLNPYSAAILHGGIQYSKGFSRCLHSLAL